MTVPELKRRGYPDAISLGSLAGSGTLGILIPPSIIMVVYAVAAEVSIIQIFLAGLPAGLPGDGAVLRLHHRLGAAEPRQDAGRRAGSMSFVQKLRASKELIPCLALIAFVIWVILAGYATATEAAAFGVAGLAGCSPRGADR